MNEKSDLNLGHFYMRGVQPHHIALIHHQRKITYKELDRQINQFAYYLLSIGIKPGDAVALSCYNSPEFIYSYFAATKIGAVIVPLNLMLTMEEIEYILSNAQVKALIAHEKIADKLNLDEDILREGIGLQELIVLNSATEIKISQAEPKELPHVDPQSMATLLYTSGTTGKPKGAMLSHANLLENAHSCEIALEGSGSDIFLCVLPMFHTFGFTVCVLLPLYVGSTIVIHDAFHPKEVIESLISDNITVFAAVPAMYVVLSHAFRSGAAKFPSLRLAVSGGAPLPGEILHLFHEKYGIPLLEGYGLTEASPVVSFNPLSGEKKAGSVGFPIANVSVKIIDENGRQLPPNQVGEILVHGPNVMSGYFRAPDETESAIRNGWLYTGDMAYLDEEGYIFIVDRKKELIITRGLNVYPREVEEALYAHPKVLEAAVIGAPDATRGEIVKAFVVLKEGEKMERKELTHFLHQKLANYKLPRIMEFRDHLPKNAAGKILKKQLK